MIVTVVCHLGSIVSLCPVAALAQEANGLLRRYNRLDAQDAATVGDAIPERLYALEARAARLAPRSAVGRLYLALIAHGAGDALAEIAADEPDAPAFAERRRRASSGLVRALARPGYGALMRYYAMVDQH